MLGPNGVRYRGVPLYHFGVFQNSAVTYFVLVLVGDYEPLLINTQTNTDGQTDGPIG